MTGRIDELRQAIMRVVHDENGSDTAKPSAAFKGARGRLK